MNTEISIEPENNLYRLKVVRKSLQDSWNDHCPINQHDINERKRLTEKLCDIEKFLDNKHQYHIQQVVTLLHRRKAYTTTLDSINKQGYKKITENMNAKCKKFLGGIHSKMALQNKKSKNDIFYNYELMFFRNGNKKCPDNIIVRIVRAKSGIDEALIWVGLVDGKYHIFY